MGITRGVTFTYNGQAVGGGSYHVHGPFAVSKSFDQASITYMVIVLASSDSGLASACSTLEEKLSARDGSLTLANSGQDWGTYMFGQRALNTTCTITKGGDRQTDTGRSRAYTVTFQCLLSPAATDGLVSIDAAVAYTPARQASLTISGEWRALDGTTALAKYLAGIGAKESAIQNVVGSSENWELVGEQYSYDRNNHVLRFTRSFTGLLYTQPGGFSDANIVQHRVVFTRTSSYPGDSDNSTNRPERFTAEFHAFVDKDQVVGLNGIQSLYENTVLPWIKSEFRSTWSPRAFAIVQHPRNVNPTSNEISGQLEILAYMPGSDLIESTKTVSYIDTRTIDYTPVWNGDELAAYADQGFLVRLRQTTKTETKFGKHDVKPPLSPGAVKKSGWNVLSGKTSATPRYIGEDPDRVLVTLLVEETVERFTNSPGGASGQTTESARGDRPGWSGSTLTESELDRQIHEMGGERAPWSGKYIGTVPGGK